MVMKIKLNAALVFQPYIDAPYGNLGGTATLSPLASETR
jgi:hypothetical protein